MSDPKTVLIVEDEKNIVDILRFNLQRAGYQTLEAYDGEDGLAQAVSANPDLILLDVMLPKKNGFDVCRALRDQGSSVPVIILCDTSHQIQREGAQTLMFDKGADSVDFALVNRVKPEDIVVTQDYGLASMCLAKCARVLNQNGLEYTADNIDALMLRRYENKKLLRAGKHPKGSPKRTKEQDVRFADTLEKTLSKNY